MLLIGLIFFKPESQIKGGFSALEECDWRTSPPASQDRWSPTCWRSALSGSACPRGEAWERSRAWWRQGGLCVNHTCHHHGHCYRSRSRCYSPMAASQPAPVKYKPRPSPSHEKLPFLLLPKGSSATAHLLQRRCQICLSVKKYSRHFPNVSFSHVALVLLQLFRFYFVTFVYYLCVCLSQL